MKDDLLNREKELAFIREKLKYAQSKITLTTFSKLCILAFSFTRTNESVKESLAVKF